jgi:DNA polymerase-1
MKKVVIVDTFNFLHRAFHAIPKSFRAPDNTPTNAVYGVCSMLISLVKETKPDCVLAALDSQKPTFRSEEFSNYKAQRKEMDEELKVQIPYVFQAINLLGIQTINCEGYEADDVIGTLVTNLKNEAEVYIVSNDKDMWQLIDKNVFVLIPNTKGTFEKIDEAEALKRLEFDKKRLVDFKALRGDTSDNIPGVYGIGEVTAKKLISKYSSIEDIYKHINEIEPESLQKKLIENVETAYMSLKLATIVTDAPVRFNLSDCNFNFSPTKELTEMFQKLNFKSLLKRLNVDTKQVNNLPVPENQGSLF